MQTAGPASAPPVPLRPQSGDPRPRSGLFGDHDHPGPELLRKKHRRIFFGIFTWKTEFLGCENWVKNWNQDDFLGWSHEKITSWNQDFWGCVYTEWVSEKPEQFGPIWESFPNPSHNSSRGLGVICKIQRTRWNYWSSSAQTVFHRFHHLPLERKRLQFANWKPWPESK